MTTLKLPEPTLRGVVSLEEALLTRRSVRQFSSTALTLKELGQLAWAAQGRSDLQEGFRTAPSAGALYPLELYFLTAQGVFHYQPTPHNFARLSTEDLRSALSHAALDQAAIALAPCSVVITSVTQRTRVKYGARASRYVALEAGHVAQNLLLQAVALRLSGVPIGAFSDAGVQRLLSLTEEEEPLYVIALGHPPK